MASVRASDAKQETCRYQTRNNHELDHSFCVLINISDEENREDLLRGAYSGEGQESVPDLADATRRIDGEKGNRERRRQILASMSR
jgi:hypothetical protein